MIVYILIVSILVAGVAFAAAGEFDEAKAIIAAQTSCSQLSNGQLEMVGDYYMEQMHPGEEHVLMDGMMGGEGSDSLRQVHISIAQRIYCGERGGGLINGGMMGMMGGWGYSGMMGSLGGIGLGVGFLFMLLFWALIILALYWLIKQLLGAKTTETGSRGSGESALNILKTRYASGEISKADFDRIKTDLDLEGK